MTLQKDCQLFHKIGKANSYCTKKDQSAEHKHFFTRIKTKRITKLKYVIRNSA